MYGKGALIFVVGFSMIISMYQVKLSKLTVLAADNFNVSYTKALAHEETMNAINIGISNLWESEAELDSFYMITPTCSTYVKTSVIGSDSVQVKAVSTTRIGSGMLGDGSILDSVTANFSFYTPVSEYLNISNSIVDNNWGTGDTLYGSLHCNRVLIALGSPVFYGKVTANWGIFPNPSGRFSNARFYGGWEIGIDIELPTDMSNLVNVADAANGEAEMNTKSLYDIPAQFKFLPNGDVIRVINSVPDTVSLSSIAPTGVIHSTAEVSVQGILNGNITIYSEDDIWIDDELVYASDPRENTDSDDILGLISDQNIILTDYYEGEENILLHGSLLAKGRFVVELPPGNQDTYVFELVGSVAQVANGPMGDFEQWLNQFRHSFAKKYYHDPRLYTITAPYFPSVRSLRLISWWE